MSTISSQLFDNIPSFVKHQGIIDWVKQIATLTQPDRIEWCDGSEEEDQRLLQQMCDQGTMVKLNEQHSII
mgnify:FL=1